MTDPQRPLQLQCVPLCAHTAKSTKRNFAVAMDVKDEEPLRRIANAIADCLQTRNFRPRFSRGGVRRVTDVEEMQKRILAMHEKFRHSKRSKPCKTSVIWPDSLDHDERESPTS